MVYFTRSCSFCFPFSVVIIAIARRINGSAAFSSSFSKTNTNKQLYNKASGGALSTLSSLYLANNNNDKNSNYVEVPRSKKMYKMGYKLVNNNNSNSNNNNEQAPVIVIHGGPGLPSDYLLPLQETVAENRPLIFYDQIGCGISDVPFRKKDYSIDWLCDDLNILIHQLNLKKFHLYGHSFGGIVAYEFLKKYYLDPSIQQCCLSVTLSNTPADIGLSNADWEQLERKVGSNRFHETHISRTGRSTIPKPLAISYQKAGRVWSGTDVIADYRATNITTTSMDHSILPPVLLIRGEYDFVSLQQIEIWKAIIKATNIEFVELDECSHHPLLENPDRYSTILEQFWSQYDKQ